MAERAVIGCGGDRHRHDLILKIPGTHHRHFREVWSRPDAMGVSCPRFKEDRDGLPDLPVVKGESFGAIKVQENIGAFFHCCGEYLLL